MHPDLPATLVKVAIPLALIVIVLVVARRRRDTWKTDFGLSWPPLPVTAIWMAIWVGWVFASEFAIRAFGLEQAAPWKPWPLLIIVLRIAAIGLLGPVSEELVVRGVLFYRIGLTRLGPVGAIVIGAAGWAAVHVQYDPMTRAMIFCDGLVLGTARLKTRSVYVPMVMHALANLYSISQSLTGA